MPEARFQSKRCALKQAHAGQHIWINCTAPSLATLGECTVPWSDDKREPLPEITDDLRDYWLCRSGAGFYIL